MKLIRHGRSGQERPGILIDGSMFDLTGFGEDYTECFFETDGLERLSKFLKEQISPLPGIDPGVRLGAPVARPSKIICIGLNYADHAREAKVQIPPEPVIFLKSTTAMSGPYDDIILPKHSEKTDWEVELAVVIRKRASYVSESEALEYIAGYLLHNDVSERSFQLERSGTWDKGKGCDSFAPLGPYLATPDEIPDPDNLRLWLKVNGKLMQDGNTSKMVYRIPYLIAYISQFMTLLPGDIVSTGTPCGVGMGFSPAIYLRSGDQVELGIERLGISRQNVKEYK